jgi:hypothetical protein
MPPFLLLLAFDNLGPRLVLRFTLGVYSFFGLVGPIGKSGKNKQYRYDNRDLKI